MATSLLNFFFYYFDVGKCTGTKQVLFLKKARARSLKCPHKLLPARTYMEKCFLLSLNLWDSEYFMRCTQQPASVAEGVTDWEMMKHISLPSTCYRIRPFAHTKGPFSKQGDHQLSLKSGPVNIAILKFPNSPPRHTCFHDLAFLQASTTWLSALQPLLMLLRHAS